MSVVEKDLFLSEKWDVFWIFCQKNWKNGE